MRTMLVLSVIFMTAALSVAAGDPFLDKAREMRNSGRYGDARARLEAGLEEDAANPALAAELAELLLETGEFEAAGEAADRAPADPRCLTLKAESLLARGRLDEARSLAKKAIEEDPSLERARYLVGMLHLRRGERDRARAAFEWFFDHYADNDLMDPEALTLVAAASVRAAELDPSTEMDFEVTMKLLDSVTKEHPDYLPAYLEKAELYLAAYQDMDAAKWFKKALERNPRSPRALYGMAEQSAFRFNELGGVEKCREALLTNPNYFPAREFIARVRIGDSQYDDAKEQIDKVLAVNPRRLEARALDGIRDYFLGDRAAYEKQCEAVLADHPLFSEVYSGLASVMEQHRRFEEASEWATKATEVDADDYQAWWTRGRNLVHLALETEAREALTKSRDLDPFAHYWGNPFRENMEEVLGVLEEFVETRTRNFVFKIHVGENAVLTKYYHHFMEDSWERLTKKYGFEPEGPILTEVFHRHDDFAARTIGLPGIGALGACFGKVITLDSPSARDPGAFTWASTAHHEFAHVITLQLSKGRVPRWFTEGLSVYEERRHSDWWERDMDRQLFDAWSNGEIFPIEKFNREFRGPNVMFAYYLGGIMCEFIAEEFGFDSIVSMLKAYAENKQDAEVLSSVLGITPAEYDRRFSEWVGKMVGDFKMAPRWSKQTIEKMQARLDEAPGDLEALTRVAWGFFGRGNRVDALTYLGRALKVDESHPPLLLLRGASAFVQGRHDKAKEWYEAYLATGEDDLFARLHLAQLSEKAGEFEAAKAHYEAAKKCFPSYAGQGNAYLELARLKLGEEDQEGWKEEIETFVKLANTDLPHRLELADYYETSGEHEQLSEVLTEVVYIYPLGEKSSVPVHARLARARRELGDLDGAVREFEVAVELGLPAEEEPGVRVELGESYRLQGRTREARFQAETALELNPEFEPAKALLERLETR